MELSVSLLFKCDCKEAALPKSGAHYEIEQARKLDKRAEQGIDLPQVYSLYVTLLRFEREVVSIAGVEANFPADPNDNPLLATLIASKADWLITGDNDFDELSGLYPIIAPSEFVQRFL
jgi:predicted nucleic acid-binding protein